MSKQSDIRDGLKRILGDDRLVTNTLFFLEKSQVVIKVDEGLPEVEEDCPFHRLDEQAKMLRDGYTAVEPLIEE